MSDAPVNPQLSLPKRAYGTAVRARRRATRPVARRARRWKALRELKIYWRTAPAVFVHINKTGGRSISAALGQPGSLHLAAMEVRSITADRPDAFLFSVVRNPFDRLHSMYHYRRRTDEQRIRSKGLSFEEWFVRAFLRQEPALQNSYGRSHFFGTQSSWLSDDNGDLLVDTVLRFESLAAGFNAMCAQRRIECELPHLNKNPHPEYRGAFSDSLREMVSQYFAEDLDRFGYEFDTSS